jgi:hypothetical protein
VARGLLYGTVRRRGHSERPGWVEADVVTHLASLGSLAKEGGSRGEVLDSSGGIGFWGRFVQGWDLSLIEPCGDPENFTLF